MNLERRGTAGIGQALRVCPSVPHHSASVPPARPCREGMSMQAVVSRPAGLVGRWSRNSGRSGRTCAKVLGVQSNNYWSSTTNANNTDNAWNVNLNDGNVNNNDKTNTNYVWPVRGGV